jgi:hypothetical protein
MRIEYTCDDGSRTLALWPSMALLHWLGRSHPPASVEDPNSIQLHISALPVPADDHEVFLTLVYGEIERRWNQTPPFEIIPPNPKLKHGGKKYQASCLEILEWLHFEGDITELRVAE